MGNKTLQLLYPNLCKLAQICLVLPLSTADCERAFSTMKRVKTPLRNRLNTKTLDSLMRIRIEGADQECFDFELTSKMAMAFAWAVSLRSGSQGRFNLETGPGKHWWHCFRSHHPELTLRTADNLERSRANA